MEVQVAMNCTVCPNPIAAGDHVSSVLGLSRIEIGRGNLSDRLDGQHLSWSRCSSENLTNARARKFRARCLKWRCGSEEMGQDGWDGFGTPRPLPIPIKGMELPPPCKTQDALCSSGMRSSLLNIFKAPGLALPRTRNQRLQCGVGVTPPLEGPRPESEAGDHAHGQPQVSAIGKDVSEEPQRLNNIPEAAASRGGGKAGSISFYAHDTDLSAANTGVPSSRSQLLSLVWLLGPFTLVASVVLPPLYLRKFFGAVLEDSLVTDFVILFFTETLFFVGAAIFLYVAHFSRLAVGGAVSKLNYATHPVYSLGYSLSAKLALGIGILLPLSCFVIVWPWTGPAAAAALAPYMIGLLAQLGFEKIILANDSPVWPLVPITFQMYRLHQLNRAAQLVAGLLFSLKGVEATAETMAINGSLQTLLLVLQVLGMLCLWSLGSFLTNQLPASLGQHTIPSLP